ncbi:MAG: hypothetical protein K2Q24_09145 [Chitinophagaceae bacterium]|nr:hypothetical protein [Chitinophagaceae bacterium]
MQIFFVFIFLALSIEVKSQQKEELETDTIYLLDYFDISHSGTVVYKGATIIYFPSGDSLKLQTKTINIMPREVEQYHMVRIVVPKKTELKIRVKLSVKRGKTIFYGDTEIVLKPTNRRPSIYYGMILRGSCSKNKKNNCMITLYNSDSILRSHLRRIVRDNIEKGVTHIYDAETGELIENTVYYN